jgi:hypothetical protein
MKPVLPHVTKDWSTSGDPICVPDCPACNKKKPQLKLDKRQRSTPIRYLDQAIITRLLTNLTCANYFLGSNSPQSKGIRKSLRELGHYGGVRRVKWIDPS